MSSSNTPPNDELSDIQSRLDRTIDELTDDRQKYHARKAAQHVIIALEGERE